MKPGALLVAFLLTPAKRPHNSQENAARREEKLIV